MFRVSRRPVPSRSGDADSRLPRGMGIKRNRLIAASYLELVTPEVTLCYEDAEDAVSSRVEGVGPCLGRARSSQLVV